MLDSGNNQAQDSDAGAADAQNEGGSTDALNAQGDAGSEDSIKPGSDGEGDQGSDDPIYTEAQLQSHIKDAREAQSSADSKLAEVTKQFNTAASDRDSAQSQLDTTREELRKVRRLSLEEAGNEKAVKVLDDLHEYEDRLINWDADLRTREAAVKQAESTSKDAEFSTLVNEVATDKKVEPAQLEKLARKGKATTKEEIAEFVEFCTPIKAPDPNKATSDAKPQPRTLPGKSGEPKQRTLRDEIDSAKGVKKK